MKIHCMLGECRTGEQLVVKDPKSGFHGQRGTLMKVGEDGAMDVLFHDGRREIFPWGIKHVAN